MEILTLIVDLTRNALPLLLRSNVKLATQTSNINADQKRLLSQDVPLHPATHFSHWCLC